MKGRIRPIVFDVGAQGGAYFEKALSVCPDAEIYAFEPNSRDFDLLSGMSVGRKVKLFKLALGEKDGHVELFCSEKGGLSSFHRRPLESTGTVEDVEMVTLDKFCLGHSIKKIDLLKLDVEGHELSCLRGARQMLPAIENIQFEMSVISRDARVYFKDIFEFLEGYKIFRILKDGLLEIKEPDRMSELLFTTNYIAVRRDASLSVN